MLVLFLGNVLLLMNKVQGLRCTIFEVDRRGAFDSGKRPKSGSLKPEWVAGLDRIARQFYSGFGGRFTPDFPRFKIIFINTL